MIGADVRFFLGSGNHTSTCHDKVYFDVDDGYLSLRVKVQRMCAWALRKVTTSSSRLTTIRS